MKSSTSIVARQCRLQEWAEQTRDCQNRPQEVSVKEWCDGHGLSLTNYYYRLREVRKACLESIPQEMVAQSIIPVSQKLLSELAPPVHSTGIDISINSFRIHVTEEISSGLLEKVLRVAANVK